MNHTSMSSLLVVLFALILVTSGEVNTHRHQARCQQLPCLRQLVCGDGYERDSRGCEVCTCANLHREDGGEEHRYHSSTSRSNNRARAEEKETSRNDMVDMDEDVRRENMDSGETWYGDDVYADVYEEYHYSDGASGEVEYADADYYEAYDDYDSSDWANEEVEYEDGDYNGDYEYPDSYNNDDYEFYPSDERDDVDSGVMFDRLFLKLYNRLKKTLRDEILQNSNETESTIPAPEKPKDTNDDVTAWYTQNMAVGVACCVLIVLLMVAVVVACVWNRPNSWAMCLRCQQHYSPIYNQKSAGHMQTSV